MEARPPTLLSNVAAFGGGGGRVSNEIREARKIIVTLHREIS